MEFMTSRRAVRLLVGAAAIALLLEWLPLAAQTPPRPGGRLVTPSRPGGSILIVKVTPRPISDDAPVKIGGSLMRGSGSLTGVPSTLSSSDRARLLREGGIEVGEPPRAPAEFRLSPREPFVSNAAYLVFFGDVEFSSAGDRLSIRMPEFTPRPPRAGILPLPEPGWASAGPQPDPPGLVGVRIRMDGPGRYVADFGVSADGPANYHIKLTGADGSGTFPKEAGGQHVVFVIDAVRSGYVQIDCWANRTFTFHNVVVARM